MILQKTIKKTQTILHRSFGCNVRCKSIWGEGGRAQHSEHSRKLQSLWYMVVVATQKDSSLAPRCYRALNTNNRILKADETEVAVGKLPWSMADAGGWGMSWLIGSEAMFIYVKCAHSRSTFSSTGGSFFPGKAIFFRALMTNINEFDRKRNSQQLFTPVMIPSLWGTSVIS